MAGLAEIPFYGAYAQRTQMNQQQPMQQLQQAQAATGLMGALEQQRQERQLRESLANSGGDIEKALSAAVASGNLAGAARLAPIVEARRKASVGQPIGAGGLRMPDGTIVPPASKPDKPPAPPELIKLQTAREGYIKAGLSEDHPFIKQIDERIGALNKGGVTINMPGSSDMVQGPDGKFYKFVIGKDGKTNVVPLQTETGDPLRPPATASERAADKTAAEALTDIGEIERLGTELDTLVSQNQGLVKGVVGPQGVVGRATELVTGALGGETPALDFDNKSKLFLSSVRKMVEKDANLSNQERANLLGSIGVGFWQTGPSSIRARGDVMAYVKNKRMGALKGGAALEQAVKSAGWAFEPEKYEYRMFNGQVQRKAR